MQALLINEDGSSGVVEVDDNDVLHSMQAMVGGWIESLGSPFGTFTTAWVNEEGKWSCEPNEVATILALDYQAIYTSDYIAGPLLITGYDPDTGETTALDQSVVEMLQADLLLIA